MKYTNSLLFSFIIVTFIIMSAMETYAQQTDSEHSLEPGANALQFQITDDFILSSFTGTVFSYKRQISKKQANRFGVSFNSAARDQDFPDRNDDAGRTDIAINLAANYTWQNYINPEVDVKFYYGYGPGVSFRYNRFEDESGEIENLRNSTEVGVSGLGYAGVEWFFQQSMSLHAEYQASVRFSFEKDRQETENESDIEVNTKNFRIGGNGVLFGVSVYF